MTANATDTLDLRPDGTVCLLGVTLRRPTFGEFRKIREGLYDLQERIAERPDQPALPDKAGPLERREHAAEARKRGRELVALVEDSNIAWLRDVVRTLADGHELAASDDLPMWVTGVGNDLVGHWQDRPASPGDR